MNLAIVNIPTEEFFYVVDHSNNPINGLDSTSFICHLFNPVGVEVTGSIPVTITGLGNGHYIASFSPNLIGTWMLTIIHLIYFPYGKSGDIQVYENNFDTLSVDLKKILGLVHRNIYIDQPTYDADGNLVGARLRIYKDSVSVGTNVNIIATYEITSDGIGPGKFSYWQQVEI